ncbi:AAA family ATPase [Sphingomonas faeni]|uniref:AAA family ATPase n=1 Tax=Sphingomonas faeni TaxID=185950 RepID=UPI003345650A
MREELSGIADAIEQRSLPETAEQLFGRMWDITDQVFVGQETFIIDFKDAVPTDFSKGFGASIIRLALAFHNTYGGIIVFGVQDDDFAPVGLSAKLDVEAFNDVLTDATGSTIECLCREYRLKGSEHRIQAMLVPRRGVAKPVRLQRKLDKYSAGTVWIRDRHSAREATESHLSMLYSDRLDLSRNLLGDLHRSVHESLPPSPATMDEFIGRKDLLEELWSWFVLGTKPRLYLHGPGGSGKSTLAYEFSRQVAERGSQVAFANGSNLDYVIYISGKESELNPYNAAEQPFSLRQFDSAITQFQAILVDSGVRTKEEARALDEESLLLALSELFATYSGLIVIDDVDALSRRGKDTGEESLLFACMGAARRTRILYTLRYPPPSALASSVKVPELEATGEFPQFIAACTSQFFRTNDSSLLPSAAESKKLAEATSRLPLLIETVIGLRKVCGTFDGALEQFDSKGGEEARRYLYQREYDRLGSTGRAREVLAALLLLDEAVTFSVLKRILNIPDTIVLDALGECGSVFLSTKDTSRGEAQYQLATPARPFIANVSSGLNLFPVIKRRVELFLAEDAIYTPEESAFIVQLDRLIRERRFKDVIDNFEARNRHDPITANPKVQALAGQAYSNLGPDFRTRARECFKAAHELQYHDIFMARAWFHVENSAEYGNREAIAVCEKVLAQRKLSSRHRAEFKSKLASCYLEEARRARNISRERAVEYFGKSIDAYLSALWIGRSVRELDEEQTLRWLSVPSLAFIEILGSDVEPFFSLLEGLVERGHDIHEEGAKVLLQALRRSSAGHDDKARGKLSGLMRRTVQRLTQHATKKGDLPGFDLLVETLSLTQQRLTPARNPRSG